LKENEGGNSMNQNYYYEQSSSRDKNLARAYVPFQYMNQVYSPEEALRKGTIFPELYKPYKINKGY